MTTARTKLICTGCFQDKPREDFLARRRDHVTGAVKVRQPCRACCAEMWRSWSTEKREARQHAEQVQLNRLINSIRPPKQTPCR